MSDLRTVNCIRKGVELYDSASVAGKTRHLEDLSDLRVSGLRGSGLRTGKWYPVAV
jgi:hypothetical protein